MNNETSHEDNEQGGDVAVLADRAGLTGRPRHALGSAGDAPRDGWKTWQDVPLVLKPYEVALVLGVSRSTSYAALRDGTIPSFRVRNALRCTREAAWAVANGLDPQEYVGEYPFG